MAQRSKDLFIQKTFFQAGSPWENLYESRVNVMSLVYVKKFGRVILAAVGHCYDLYRFFKYGGWKKDFNDQSQRNYNQVKTYHGLEKNISYTNREVGHGASTVKNIKQMLLSASKSGEYGYHDFLAYKALKEFSSYEGLNVQDCIPVMDAEFNRKLGDYSEIRAGAAPLEDVNQGYTALFEPEKFFLSRYSVRNFEDKPVPQDLIEKALLLAHKTPSACNRQPWHVYNLKSQSLIDKALSIQNGNRGFGDKIKSLLVLCVEDQAFISGNERYQHWIDGGLYSMSLIYAFHALGISSCCLNWSQMPKGDIRFRREIGISKKHTIVMLLAIGYPEKKSLVCCSPRRPLSEVVTVLN